MVGRSQKKFKNLKILKLILKTLLTTQEHLLGVWFHIYWQGQCVCDALFGDALNLGLYPTKIIAKIGQACIIRLSIVSCTHLLW